MMPDKKKGKDEITAPPSDEVVLATLRNKYAWCMTVRYVAIVLSVGLLLLMTTPLARQIAGKNTDFNVNVTLALSATLAFTTAGAFVYAARQRDRAKHLESRNGTLTRRVEELQNKLDKLEA
jgi:Ni,Fe-hydrogenase I large subunit